jgi:hypothetical protein
VPSGLVHVQTILFIGFPWLQKKLPGAGTTQKEKEKFLLIKKRKK